MGESRNQCDWMKGEVWSLNNGYRQIAMMKGRIDKVFLAHTQCYYPSDKTAIFNWSELNQLADAGVDVINTHKVKGLKSKLFPYKRLVEKFDTEFYSDTVCYQLAYAVDLWTVKKNGRVRLKDPDEEHVLWLFGVDMLTLGEYQLEKGGVEYWIGYARGLGITVNISKGSSLCQTATGEPYGKKYFTMKDLDFGKFEKMKQAIRDGEDIPENPCFTNDDPSTATLHQKLPKAAKLKSTLVKAENLDQAINALDTIMQSGCVSTTNELLKMTKDAKCS